MPTFGTPIEKTVTYEKYADNLQNALRMMNAKADAVKLGGGNGAIDKHHKRGKLTARERIQKLIDPDSNFLEIGLFTAYGMYEEYGGAPSSGTVFGIGTIHGRDVVIVANDATVKAGAWFPMTCKKNLRASGNFDREPSADCLSCRFRRRFPADAK